MILLLALLGPDARFEADGLRMGDVLLRGPLLELRSGALVSGQVVEPLEAAVGVGFDGLRLILEPGVRVTRDVGGFRLSAHAPATLRMSTAADSWPAGETARLARGEAGWTLDGRALPGEVRVQARPQDDPDAALRAMQESARRLRESGQRVRLPLRRRVFSGYNPFIAGHAARSEAVRRRLAEVSLSGF
jgi:hypothetical protein